MVLPPSTGLAAAAPPEDHSEDERQQPERNGDEVEDVYDTIANATVRSAVYREYVQLVRTPEGWKIVNALWAWT